MNEWINEAVQKAFCGQEIKWASSNKKKEWASINQKI